MARLNNQEATSLTYNDAYLNPVLQEFYSCKKFRLDVLALRDDKKWIKESQCIYTEVQLSSVEKVLQSIQSQSS